MARAAAAARAALLLLAVVGILIGPAAAEIKQESFKDDDRSSILFEKFRFSPHGMVSVSVDGARASSALAKPDPSQLGFFLLFDEALFEAIYEQPPPTDLNPNPESSPNCVLSSPSSPSSAALPRSPTAGTHAAGARPFAHGRNSRHRSSPARPRPDWGEGEVCGVADGLELEVRGGRVVEAAPPPARRGSLLRPGSTREEHRRPEVADLKEPG